MVYTLDELREKITPIAKKYGIPAVWIFGSYALGVAMEPGDVDMLLSRRGLKITSLFDMGALYHDLNENLGKGLDIVELKATSTDNVWEEPPWFIRSSYDERIKIYGTWRHSTWRL